MLNSTQNNSALCDGAILARIVVDVPSLPREAPAGQMNIILERSAAVSGKPMTEGLTGDLSPMDRSGARQSALWKVRRAVFPTIIQRPGPRKAWGFVEDPIVPRDRVPEFIEFLAGLARRHGTEAGIYGHIGDGNTHFRPFFDPTDPADFERMQALRVEFDDAVLDRFRGAPSGEHGIGRIRADKNRAKFHRNSGCRFGFVGSFTVFVLAALWWWATISRIP